MPVKLRKDFGTALDVVQQGMTPPDAKMLKGVASGTMQLSEDHAGDTYRAIYTVEFDGIVYVLHCFQKKSKKGKATPKTDLELIATRMKAARKLHEQRKGS